MKLRILLADDHEIVRRGLCSLLQKREGWEVCGEASDGLNRLLRPDVAALTHARGDVLESLRDQLRERHPDLDLPRSGRAAGRGLARNQELQLTRAHAGRLKTSRFVPAPSSWTVCPPNT